MKFIWIILAFMSGAFLPIQAGINSRLGKTIESPVHASLISFVVGAIAVYAYSVFTKQHVTWNGLRTAPGFVWLGGFMGAFYVTTIILAFPKIGPALTFGLVVAGQMILSVLLDHFDVLVAQRHSINLLRLAGIVLIIGGVIILRKF